MSETRLYATPPAPPSRAECRFYHTIDLPGHGVIHGDWDLRTSWREYLGGVDFRGRRVLEMGTAGGFLCFSMEQAGADVVAFDIARHRSWDVVPFHGVDTEALIARQREEMSRVNNAYWLAHHALGSKARVVYGSVYDVPRELGPVDIVTFTSILLHLRDPFGALQSALPLSTEKVIIAERMPRYSWMTSTFARGTRPLLQFTPNHKKTGAWGTWWRFTPEALVEMIAVLGFPNAETSYHTQRYGGKLKRMFTIVGTR